MTDIEIVNLALSDCGVAAIATFNDGTPAANQAKAKYLLYRDAFLESREWTPAVTRLVFALDAVAPVFGFTYQYIIPSNVIRVLRIYTSSGVASGTPIPADDWVREGWRILTDEAGPIYAEVLQRVDENSFSPSMAVALAARLTSVLAIPLTENRQLAKDFEDKFQTMLTDASASDGQQGRTRRMRPPPLPGRTQNL